MNILRLTAAVLLLTLCSSFLIVKAQNNPIAHWKLDETSGTTVADELGTSNGTLVNGADSLWVQGWDGNALDFSKKLGAYVEVPDNDIVEFDSTESFTISMLIKADPVDNTAEQEILMKGAFGVDASQGWEGKWYGMQFKGGEVRLAVDDNITKTQLGVDISASWPANRWAHLVGVRDITAGMLRLYLNGKLIGEMPDATTNDIASGDLPMLMGLNYQGLSPLDGQLDDVRFYDHALSQGAIDTLFESYAIPKDTMIAQWKLDETSGTTVADEFGTSNGTLVNGADSMWVEGWDGNAIDFSKKLGGYVEVPDNNIVEFDSTESFTISMLIKADPVGNSAEQEILMKGAFGVDASQGWEGKWYGMQFKGGEVRLAVDDNITKTQLGVDISAIWPSNRWAHLVGVRDVGSGMLKLYLNGVLIGEMEDATKNDIASGDLPMLMGLNYQGLSPLDGQLDDVRFYNYPLNPAAVDSLFESYGIQKDVMLAYWKFNESSGTTVADQLGSSDGTLVNGADSMWVEGWDGNALDFSKKLGGYVEVPDNNNVLEFDSTDSFTISMLIKADPVGNAAEQEIIMKGAFGVDASQGWAGKWYGMQFKGGEVRLAVDDNITKTQLGVDISTMWPSNQWAYLVGVRDITAGMLRLYLNGELIGEMPDETTNDIASDSLPVLMGINYQGLSPLDGQIDELKIFNYPMNAAAVKAMYDEYALNPALAAYWKFDESSGTTVADSLGNSNGTLVNGADSLWVPGWDGNAIDFSKILGAYVEVPDNDFVEFDSTESFSISMLINADPVGNTAEQEIIMKGAFGVDSSQDWFGKWYGMQFKGGEVRLAVDDNITKTQLGVDISNIWPSNEWAQLVGVRDLNEDSLKLYLNGKWIGSIEDGTENDIASDTLPLLMGINYQGLSPLDGQLDNVKLYNYALSPNAVQALFDESGIIVSVNGDDNQSVPTKFALEQNYPNPFNPSTKIKYSIPTSSKVKLIVYDILGRKVVELVNQVQNAGYYEVNFNASNLSSGVYFYRISYSNQFLTKKMLLLK